MKNRISSYAIALPEAFGYNAFLLWCQRSPRSGTLPVRFKCPNPECDCDLRLKDELSGKRVKCPKCGKATAFVARLCPKCHKPLAWDPKSPPTTCPLCKAKLVDETL